MNTTDPTTNQTTGPTADQSTNPMPNPGPTYHQPKRLYRSRDDHMIGGVCGGVARYLGVDPTLVRVIAVVALVFAFPATIVGYLLAWAIMPQG